MGYTVSERRVPFFTIEADKFGLANVLSCDITDTCVNSGTAVGCSGLEGTALYTTCVGYF